MISKTERRARWFLLACILIAAGLCFVPGIDVSSHVQALRAGPLYVSFLSVALSQLTGGMVSGIPCGICLFGSVICLTAVPRQFCVMTRGIGTGLAAAAAFRALSVAKYLGGGFAANWPLYSMAIAIGIGVMVYVPVFLHENTYRGRRLEHKSIQKAGEHVD